MFRHNQNQHMSICITSHLIVESEKISPFEDHLACALHFMNQNHASESRDGISPEKLYHEYSPDLIVESSWDFKYFNFVFIY